MIRVMMLTDLSREPERKILRGLVQYANERGGWTFCPVSPFLRESPEYCKDILDRASKIQADAIFGTWPGIIPEMVKEAGIPVFLRNWREHHYDITTFSGKNHEIGEMGASFFLKKHYDSFAFFGFKDIIWSEERLEGFSESVKRNGHFSSLMIQETSQDWTTIENWLRDLPKPVAVMASNDVCAQIISEVCQSTGIVIPDDVALLGVDNDEFLCNITYPGLSSINLDFEKLGYELGKRIEDSVKNKTMLTGTIYHHPTGIVERGSTLKHIIHDKYISKIVDRIEEQFTECCDIEELISDIPLSRRTIEMRFRNEMGGVSMLKYLISLKINHFSHLLETTDLPVSVAAEKSGFTDFTNVFRTFKKYTGYTPLNYRHKFKTSKVGSPDTHQQQAKQ